jgi:HAD superfamily phosphatase (TIGR01668 family)
MRQPNLIIFGDNMSIFIPDLICDTVYDIPISFFTEKGIKLLFMDIDNTLVTYDDAYPTDKNLLWFDLLRENGIDVAFVSNNDEKRVSEYASETKYSYFADAKKPLNHIHKMIMKNKGLKPCQCASVGDQIFTDILAAHLLGASGVLVSPIKDLTGAFTRFKRLLEKPFIRVYKRRNKKEEQK